jgi:hypothetical protein
MTEKQGKEHHDISSIKTQMPSLQHSGCSRAEAVDISADQCGNVAGTLNKDSYHGSFYPWLSIAATGTYGRFIFRARDWIKLVSNSGTEGNQAMCTVSTTEGTRMLEMWECFPACFRYKHARRTT